MRTLECSLQDRTIEVTCHRSDKTLIGIGDSAFQVLGQYFASDGRVEPRDSVIIADRRVWNLHACSLKNQLEDMSIDHRVVLVDSGERSKSLETLYTVWSQLEAVGTKRRTTIFLAFGGGVVCDMAGFAAATYMRGIPYALVPTTLVAQIDAAIGGKVAVDTPGAKNSLGAFYHPRAVVIWPGFLQTLPTAELASGMAEVIKVATLASSALFEEVESLGKLTSDTVSSISEGHLTRWIQAKLEFLAPDPFEVGSLDRALNFGHSFGHAIESATHYRSFRHGEAVAIGMAIACRIATARGVLAHEVASRILGCLMQNDLPTEVPGEIMDDVWQALDLVRSIRNGELREVLPTGLGEYCFVNDITHAEYLTASIGRHVLHA